MTCLEEQDIDRAWVKTATELDSKHLNKENGFHPPTEKKLCHAS
jgi:hypothetical protein